MAFFWSIFAREAMKSPFLVAKYFCFLNVINNYLGFFAYLDGTSMLPTLHATGNLVLGERISARFGKVGRGDIVVLRSPENPKKFVTKRVIGIESDRITYLVDPKNSEKCETVVVPKGHIWIQGDYIHNSRDSRMFGPVPYGLLKGKVILRIWPFEDFGPLRPRPT